MAAPVFWINGCSLKAPAQKDYHPGEGRGPIGKVAVMKRAPTLTTFTNWAPAFAGVVLLERAQPAN